MPHLRVAAPAKRSLDRLRERGGGAQLHSGHTYGHLIPGANLSFVDRLDEIPPEPAETSPQQSAPPAQPGEMELPPDLVQVVEKVGGSAWTRTTDLRIMSRLPGDDSKEFQQDSSVDSGKLLQNPQPPRNQEQAIPPANQAKDEGHAPTKGDCPPPLPPSGPIPRKQ
jgi:hypothetical protein